MPNGPGRLGPGTAPGPIAPTHRPRWLLVLSSVTLMYGGMLLISGLGDLRNPTAAAKLPMARPMASKTLCSISSIAFNDTRNPVWQFGVRRLNHLN